MTATDEAHSREPGSFRDPAGFVFRRAGRLLRQINRSVSADWDAVESSGLLDGLTRDGLLIGHEVVDVRLAADPAVAYLVIAPDAISFISYPYEWSFGQLKEAALLTLEVERRARAKGFTLIDASGFNIQFHQGRAVLIDTLSVRPARPGDPWPAYRQFCEHFLAPLALMGYVDVRLSQLLMSLEGIPLPLAARLLPLRSRANLGLLGHLHAHARAQSRTSSAPRPNAKPVVGATGMAALLDNLTSTVAGIHWKPGRTAWVDYEARRPYEDDAARAKEHVVREFLRQAGGDTVWDIGANTGRYSAIAASEGRSVVALDDDAGATEVHYQQLRARAERSIVPILQDITHPSPRLGFAGEERSSLEDRANADVVLALAVVHHLSITRNVPLGRLAEFFSRLAPQLIVEWVPREDPMVAGLLERRPDGAIDYDTGPFHEAFVEHYELIESRPLPGSVRTIHLMRGRHRV